MKLPHILLTVILSAAVAFVTGKYVAPRNDAAASVRESAYDRVMRSGVLRCGYGIWAPGLIRDPQSGKLDGIFYAAIEIATES